MSRWAGWMTGSPITLILLPNEGGNQWVLNGSVT